MIELRRKIGQLALIADVSVVGVGLTGGSGAIAGAPASVNADAGGLALYGYDPVAYTADGKATAGDPAVTATHDGATYRFSTPAHRDAFVKEPERYLPVFGGYCAYGVAQGYKVKVDPEAWSIVDDKLYLNYDSGVRKLWSKDTAGFIAAAAKKWSSIEDEPRSD